MASTCKQEGKEKITSIFFFEMGDILISSPYNELQVLENTSSGLCSVGTHSQHYKPKHKTGYKITGACYGGLASLDASGRGFLFPGTWACICLVIFSKKSCSNMDICACRL
jgi:hypothetical protein